MRLGCAWSSVMWYERRSCHILFWHAARQYSHTRQRELIDGHFDGAYTYFASERFVWGSTSANWQSIRCVFLVPSFLCVDCFYSQTWQGRKCQTSYLFLASVLGTMMSVFDRGTSKTRVLAPQGPTIAPCGSAPLPWNLQPMGLV